MKIKTITCHNVYNTGASLQAYALAQYLKGIGNEVEIIDYVPDYLTHHKFTGIGNLKYAKPVLRELYLLLKLPGRIKERYGKRKREFDKFTAKYLPLTQMHYSSYEELCENPPEADIVFAGSDQIWNTLFKNGKDPAFYLQFMPDSCVRASYAASFATPDVVDEWKDQVKKWLTDLDYISVREKTGVKIIENLGICTAVQVMDPVFLLSKEEWEQMTKENIFSEKYIFLYDFDVRADIAEYAKKIAKRNGWKIYSFLKNSYADKCFHEEGPEMFLALIKQSQMVISNSFHATVFSIILEKKFVVFNRRESINTRMQDLLNILNLSERLLFEPIEKMDVIEIDYPKIGKNLRREVVKSKEYITKVIEKTKEKYEEESFVCN